MGRNNITFVIFAYNEEKRIEYPIRNFIDYWEVIIIDNFSEDKTKEVAEKFWAKVYQYKNQWYVETEEELEFVRSKVDTDYMTRTFADIMRDKNLLEKVIEITRQWNYDWIAANHKNYHYWFNNLTFGSLNSKWKEWFKLVCVYKKELIYCSGIIHYSLLNKCKKIFYVPRKIGKVHHFSTYNIQKITTNYNIYTDIESKMRFDDWQKVSFIKLFIKLFAFFILYFFIEWWYKSGKAWLIMVIQMMIYFFNVWAKQRELENNVTLDSIENNYTNIKTKMLNDF